MKKLLTIREAASYLKMPERTLNWMLNNNRIKGEKYGGVWLLKASDVVKYASKISAN